DLRRVDIESTGDDDFFDAGYQADKAIFFHYTDVTGAEPITVEGFFSGFRLVEIALKDLRPANQQFAFFTIGHSFIYVLWVRNAPFGIRERKTNIGRTGLAVHGITTHSWGGFSQTVAFHQLAAGKVFPVLNGGDWQGRSTGESIVDACNFDILLIRCSNDLLV